MTPDDLVRVDTGSPRFDPTGTPASTPAMLAARLGAASVRLRRGKDWAARPTKVARRAGPGRAVRDRGGRPSKA